MRDSPKKSEFRDMPSRSNRKCPYCGILLYMGETIWGDYGIRWGHHICVEEAYKAGGLLPSKANADRRRPELTERLLAQPVKHIPQPILQVGYEAPGVFIQETNPPSLVNKKNLPFTDEWFGKPETSCPHFATTRLALVTLPLELRPHDLVDNELSPEELAAALSKIWDRYLKEYIARHKRVTRHLPECRVHQWSLDPADHLQIKVTTPGGYTFDYRRTLWWFCPGKETT